MKTKFMLALAVAAMAAMTACSSSQQKETEETPEVQDNPEMGVIDNGDSLVVTDVVDDAAPAEATPAEAAPAQ